MDSAKHVSLLSILDSFKIWKKERQYLFKAKVCVQAGNLVTPDTVAAVKEIGKISLVFQKTQNQEPAS